VLNKLLVAEQQPQLDIATAYFSIRGYELVRATLPGVRRLRLLLGDNPQDGSAVGLRPDSRAYLRNELNAEPLTQATQALVEELIRFLRRRDVEVRLYLGHDLAAARRRTFLHAKCYLIYGGRGEQQALFDYLNPLVGIVGSSNFTAPGLKHNNELNLVHKTLLQPAEVDDQLARSEVMHHAQIQSNVGISPKNQLLLKSEVGARAILDLAAWFDGALAGISRFQRRVDCAAGRFQIWRPGVHTL
jgi:phosphatidylserine/phosphatidylglycerophosphate/cardiolipin synthase-like enzyme